MDASPALVRGKVRIVDHLVSFISLKKHTSPASAAIPRRRQQAFQAKFSATPAPLCFEGVGEGAVEGGHGSTSADTRTLRKRRRVGQY